VRADGFLCVYVYKGKKKMEIGSSASGRKRGGEEKTKKKNGRA